ncbi:MAG: WecB/TagA/CpsF family glycosyltransferase [Chloroflexi bacterium]|nr:WecB/TagA/CpsF family glycosyltransferase [Chloroflexota bacterium]
MPPDAESAAEADVPRPSPRSVDVLGVRVDDVTMDEALALARAWLRAGRGWHVVTPNAEFVMAAQEDPEFRAILNRAHLAIPDGAGLLLAGRLLGTPLREQVTGTDLTTSLVALAAAEGYRVFLLGAAPGVAETTASSLRRRFPGLTVAGTFAGSPRPAGEAEIRAALAAAAPIDILFVAFGAPVQEKWIAHRLPTLDVGLAMGVGGVFDFLSGQVPRAPAWLRGLGLDWLFRLIVQPWRWRRQLALPRFVVDVAGAAVRRRLGLSKGS